MRKEHFTQFDKLLVQASSSEEEIRISNVYVNLFLSHATHDLETMKMYNVNNPLLLLIIDY